jgi:hypothetical protein
MKILNPCEKISKEMAMSEKASFWAKPTDNVSRMYSIAYGVVPTEKANEVNITMRVRFLVALELAFFLAAAPPFGTTARVPPDMVDSKIPF